MEFISNNYQSMAAWLRFIRDLRWNRKQKKHLLEVFEAPSRIYQQSESEINAVANANSQYPRQRKSSNRESVEQKITDRDLDWIKQAGATLITQDSSYYPEQLKHIDDAPLALFALGNIDLLHEPQVAMVGSRQPSPVGAKVASEIAADLSKLGLVITSGMALGIDGLCHQAALDEKAATIAVLGCGLDIIYPARHRRMYQCIRENGLLVSEYPLGIKPTRYSFPERNRIVSGLALGVIILEAAMRSGTLITARLALEQNKEVMVLPGSAVSKQYEGSHRLLREGAALVTCVDDVLSILSQQLSGYGVSEPVNSDVSEINGVKDSDLESYPILSLIGAEAMPVDQIILNSGLTPAQVSSMLLELELKGQIVSDGRGGYVNLA